MIRGVKENWKAKGWSVVKTLLHSHNMGEREDSNGEVIEEKRAGRVNLAKGTEKIDLILVSQATVGKGNQEVLRRNAVGGDHYPICMGL